MLYDVYVIVILSLRPADYPSCYLVKLANHIIKCFKLLLSTSTIILVSSYQRCCSNSGKAKFHQKYI